VSPQIKKQTKWLVGNGRNKNERTTITAAMRRIANGETDSAGLKFAAVTGPVVGKSAGTLPNRLFTQAIL